MRKIKIGLYYDRPEQFSHLTNIINKSFPAASVCKIISFSERINNVPELIFIALSDSIAGNISQQARKQIPNSPIILFLEEASKPEIGVLEKFVDDVIIMSELSPYLLSKSVDYVLTKRSLNDQIESIAYSLVSENPVPLSETVDITYRPLTDVLSFMDFQLKRNISELKSFVDELKSSYQRIQMIMEHSSDCFLELDSSLKVINFNRNAQEYYQLFFNGTFEIGDFILDHAPEGRSEELKALYDEVLAGKKKHLKLEVEKNGIARTFKMKYLPVVTENTVTSVTLIAEEITNEENSLKAILLRQQELLAAEKNYRDLFEKANEGIVIYDEETGKILNINQNACNIINATKEDVLSGNIDVFGHHIKGYRFSDAIRDQNRSEVNGKQTFDWQASRKDGTLCWLEISLFPTEIGGNNRILVFIRDINDRKIAEELVKTTLRAKEKIMDSSLDVICSVDWSGRFVMVSDASLAVWGYSPKELLGKRYMDMVYEEDHEKTIQIAEDIVNGIPVKNFENRYIRKDGTLVDILWSSTWDPEDKLMYATAKDASEKKKLERDLEYEQLRYREIFNKAPALIAMLAGPNHRFVMANPQYRELTGKEDIIDKTVMEVFPELASQGFISILDSIYKTGIPYEAREALVTVKNSDLSQKDLYLDFIYQPHEDSQKNIDGVIFFGIDVTEKVVARKEIREKEELYKQIVTTAQEGIWMWDEKGIVTFCNQKLCELLGYSENEIIGRLHTSFMDRSEHDFAEYYFAEVNKGAKRKSELKYRSKNGNLVWVHVAGSALRGEFKGTMAMVSDVTTKKLAGEKLKKSEANLNSIIDNTNVAYTLLDKDLKIILFNQAAYDGTLKEQGKKLEVGRHIAEFSPQERVNDIDKIYGKVLEGHVLSSTVSFINNDGKSFYSLKLFPVCSTDNHTLGVLIAMDDITERKEAEELLEKQNKELRKANEELDRFVYSASHDLRAPLASILGLLNISNLEEDVTQLRNINKMIFTSVNKLDRFVRDIIDHSRNARLEIQVEPINFKELVSESIEQLNYMQTSKNINIQILDSGINEFWSDKKRIAVIINNLLSNAIKYHNLRQSDPYIYFKINLSENLIKIRVEDNGNGIDPKSISKIFNMFYRGSENSVGSGLGLYIVKEIVEKLSGTISVKSTPGVGTAFMIDIPNMPPGFVGNC
jgi:PAS domain S-box-containing protein